MKKRLMQLIALMIVGALLVTGCKTTKESVYEDDGMTPATTEVETTTEAETTSEAIEVSTETTNPEKTYFTEHGVWYEIFVRSFADSNGDKIGDLKGLTDKLDYLNDGNPDTDSDLGVKGLWLMPINVSPSYHGYDVTDYYNVDPEYGTNEDLKVLLDEAHKRGIKVIIDLVINHSSAQHPWFVDAKANKESPYRKYYRFVEDGTEGYDFKLNVWGHKVWNKLGSEYYYAIFWDQMPDLNMDNQETRDEVKNIAKFWLELGVDGFRMDAAMHIFGQGETPKGTNTSEATTLWWNEFDLFCRSINPNYYLVGEVWDDAIKRSKFSASFDTTFNFSVAEGSGILSMVANKRDLDGKNNKFVEHMMDQYQRLEEKNPQFIDAPFLTNHDTQRASDILNGDVNEMKMAANIYMTLKGNPFIYYGEEIGMLGNKPDEQIREPFLWGDNDSYQTKWEDIKENVDTSSVQIQDRLPDSLLNHYREIITMRNGSDALTNGDFTGIETTSDQIIAYSRQSSVEKVVVVHNLAVESVKVATTELFTTEATLYYSSNAFSYEGESEIEVPAQTTLVFIVK